MKIKKKLTKNLSNNELQKILNLKKKFWKYSLASQKIWFKKNVDDNDLNFLFFDKKILIGYSLILKKKLSYKKNIKNIFILDSVVIKKNYSSKLFITFMKKIKIFLKLKTCLLVCEKKYYKFYKFFGWEIINKSLVKFIKLNKKVEIRSNQIVLIKNSPFLKKTSNVIFKIFL
tara:strand:+ start:107 stop:625 length:519 start_codon:yes stop_codon:yes gene_type:complete